MRIRSLDKNLKKRLLDKIAFIHKQLVMARANLELTQNFSRKLIQSKITKSLNKLNSQIIKAQKSRAMLEARMVQANSSIESMALSIRADNLLGDETRALDTAISKLDQAEKRVEEAADHAVAAITKLEMVCLEALDSNEGLKEAVNY